MTPHRQAAASGRDVAEQVGCHRAVHGTAERLDRRVVPAEVHSVVSRMTQAPLGLSSARLVPVKPECDTADAGQ